MVEIPFNTLWLIDDDGLSNFIHGIIIDNHYFAKSIKAFTTVQEALDSLKSAVRGEVGFPDVIFLDLEMPGLNGWDFLDTFSKLEEPVKQRCRLYMLSSSINEADALKAKEYREVCDFIVKPLTMEELQKIKATEGYLKQNNKEV